MLQECDWDEALAGRALDAGLRAWLIREFRQDHSEP